MKKSILLIAIILTAASAAIAQRQGRTRFSIGPEIGVAASNPLNNLPGNKGWGLGIGASVQADHFYRENLTGSAYLGVISYAGRAQTSNSKNSRAGRNC